MTSFSTSVHQVVSDALADLNEAQTKGKIPKNPLSETHFLAAWTTNAIKKKRYESDVLPTLTIWQRKARSLGKNAALVTTFAAIKRTYEHVFDESLSAKPVYKTQVSALCEQLIAQQWMVNTDLVVGEKLNRHSGGQASLIICTEQFESHFEDGLLVKPLSLYIRGDIPEALAAAYQHTLLLHKVTDYKSKVKYHGEYIIYPENSGEFLPELLEA
ncbi:DUF2913 family protein [Psychromonas sp. 14N.309.X.WAT.B.A12]|uniref:DUF2913 family protein n=1 Tax=Psychromonas sp. 14N.309.X.WAT.B.A12 TaxID=2998322 RepID=UPI0025AED4A3|nr:DUF2913 family protein [Psychromonas sp. 14N.309.X.WAT.B.A12]MDN2662082.1 DUF2913 family protein [Psychromonas sp. 14N.309.X.WAT.B.A12]